MRLSHGGQAVKPRKSGMPWMPWMPYPVWFTLVKQRRQGHISHQGEKNAHITRNAYPMCVNQTMHDILQHAMHIHLHIYIRKLRK